MRKIRIAACLAVFLCAAVLKPAGVHAGQSPDAPKAPKADITGTWTASFDSPIGQQDYTYEFTVKGAVLTGKATSAMGESPLTEGKVDGATVAFVEMLDGQIRVEYTGTIASADEIRFSRKVGDFGTEELVAYRKKDQK